MNAHACHCSEQLARCDAKLVNNMNNVQNNNSRNPAGCTECFHYKIPSHQYDPQYQHADENNASYNEMRRSKIGDVNSENHDTAKLIPNDRTTMTSPTIPLCYLEKESDSIHQAYAQTVSQNNHKSESNDKTSAIASSNNINKSSKPMTFNSAFVTEKSHSSTCECGRKVAAKLVTPPLEAAVNVMRPPCPYCGSRIAKCMGCGYNSYGQAYQSVHNSTIDPDLQFNSCSSVNRSLPPSPPIAQPPPLSHTSQPSHQPSQSTQQAVFIDEACEKRLNACLKDVSKNLNCVLTSLQRFKCCHVCGNHNCNA